MRFTTAVTVAATFVLVSGRCPIVVAGELEPPVPPSPTMVTLQEIHDRLEDLAGASVLAVQATGQTVCRAEEGTPIDCAGTGQDGEVRAGAAVEVRFADHGDGTVKDNFTGLVWLKEANCFGSTGWAAALSHANALADGACGLSDGSQPGDWRLPTVRESLTLVDYGHYLPALPDGHPFIGVQHIQYWSATSIPRLPNYELGHAWHVHYGGGYMGLSTKTHAYGVWPVRDGAHASP